MIELTLAEKIKIIEKSIEFFSNEADILVKKVDNCAGRRKSKYLKELQMLKRRLQTEIELLEKFVRENG